MGSPFACSFIRRLRAMARCVVQRGTGIENFVQYSPRPLRTSTPDLQDHRHLPKLLPTISIVTPSYNQGVFLERTIASVLEQNYPELEYFVQDGGSTDRSIDILNHWGSRLTGWSCEPDGGQADALNRGFARTRGQIMGWLNSDDIYMPGALYAVAQYFRTHPKVDVVYGHRIMIDPKGMEIGRWIMPPHIPAALRYFNRLPQETLFWRRTAWERVGGAIDVQFQMAMDWDLIMRFYHAGCRFARIPRFLGGFTIHPEQKTARHREINDHEAETIRNRWVKRKRKLLKLEAAAYLAYSVPFHLAWRLGFRRDP